LRATDPTFTKLKVSGQRAIGISAASFVGMQDFHVATIKFLSPRLKAKQLQLAKAAHTAEFDTHNEEFENLRKRLCLELLYAMEGESDGCQE
jgi:hypothetical protein